MTFVRVGSARDGLDTGERAQSVPGWEGSNEPRRTVKPDAGVAERLSPGEMARVPLDEGLGFGSDVEVLVETRVRLADLGLAMLEQQPVPLVAAEAAEIEPDDHAPVGEPVSKTRVTQRPPRDEGIEVLGRDLKPTGPPLAECFADPEQVVARVGELIVVSAPMRLGR